MIKEIDCRPFAEGTLVEVKREIAKNGRKPRLCIAGKVSELTDGDLQYINGIRKYADEIGVEIVPPLYNSYIDGAVYVGKSWEKANFLAKDIDHVSKNGSFMCVTEAVFRILRRELTCVDGLNALVIGRGKVGQQISRMLIRDNATVTIAHSYTDSESLRWYVHSADIIVIAGASGLTIEPYATDEKTPIVIDLTGGNAVNHDGFSDVLVVKHIGCLTRAILMDRLVDMME